MVVGAALFLLSDATIALTKFAVSMSPVLAQVVILSTYYAAQGLLILGALHSGKWRLGWLILETLHSGEWRLGRLILETLHSGEWELGWLMLVALHSGEPRLGANYAPLKRSSIIIWVRLLRPLDEVGSSIEIIVTRCTLWMKTSIYTV